MVLLEEVGSRPINCFLVVFIVISISMTIYLLTFFAFAFTTCQTEIEDFGSNEWFQVVYNGLPLQQLEPIFVLFRNVLEVESRLRGKEPFLQNQKGSIPWCGWCTVDDLKSLETAFNRNFSVELILNHSQSVGIDLFGEFFEMSAVSPACELNFVFTLVIAWISHGNYFLLTNGDEPGPESKTEILDCLLNGTESPNCYPCGNREAMNVTVDKEKGTITDLLSNITFPWTEANRLEHRCALRFSTEFLKPCSSETGNSSSGSYNSLYAEIEDVELTLISQPEVVENQIPSSPNVEMSKHVDRIRNLQVQASGIPSLEDLFNRLKLEQGGNFSKFTSSLVSTVNGLLSNREVGTILRNQCTNRNGIGINSPLDLVSSNSGSFFDETHEEGFFHDSHLGDAALNCWNVYFLYFLYHPMCIDAFNQTGTLTEDAGVSVLFILLVSVYVSSFFPYTMTELTRFEYGFPSINLFTALENQVMSCLFVEGEAVEECVTNSTFRQRFATNESVFASLSKWTETYDSCIEAMDEGVEELSSFFDFVDDSAEGCNQGYRWLVSSFYMSFIAWIFGVLLLIFGVHNNAIRKRSSRYSKNILLLHLAFLCFASEIFSSGFPSKRDTYIVDYFFTPSSTHRTRTIIGIFDALGLTFFYLQQVGTRIAALESCRFKADVPDFRCCSFVTVAQFNLHLVIAVIYFIFRGIIAVTVFDVSAGMVPFVNLITVFRICTDSITTDFPYCSTSLDDNALPFYGNLFVSFVDLLLFIPAYLCSAACVSEMRKTHYKVSRGPHLVIFLKRIINRMLFLNVYLVSIIYCSLVNIYFFYGGYVIFDEGSASFVGINLEETGVQEVRVGAIFMLLVYGVGWTLLMLPRNSALSKAMLSSLPEDQLSINFFTTEAEVPVSSSKKFRDHAVFDSHNFVLESHFVNWMFTHSVYDIGSLKSEDILPDEYNEIKYIVDKETDTHVWIVANHDRIIISFRGTTSATNARTDLTLSQTRLAWLTDKEASVQEKQAQKAVLSWQEHNGLVKVHSGFLKAFRTVQHEIFSCVMSHFATYPEVRKLVSTGHSLGGALACVCGVFLATAVPDSVVQIATFGCPRVGNPAFKRYAEGKVSSCWRFVKRKDPIPKTPVKVSGYEHVGVQVLLETNGDMIVDPSIVETFILHSCHRGGIVAHGRTAYLGSLLAFILVDKEKIGSSSDFRGTPEYSPRIFSNCIAWIFERAPIYLKEYPHVQEQIINFINPLASQIKQDRKLENVEESDMDTINIT